MNVKHPASKTSEDEAKKDYQNQADNIKKQVEDQKQKLADYNAKKQQYDQQRQAFIDDLKKEGLWKDGDVDPSKLAQRLVLNQEPEAQATAEALGNNGKVVDDGGYRYYRNTARTDVKGEYLRITYSNLKNSSYNGQKIGKIVLTFSNAKYGANSGNLTKDNNDLDAGIKFVNNPMGGLTYQHINSTDLTLNAYDENGNLVSFTDDAPAYLTVASLNSYTDGTHEYAKLLSNGEAIPIPESSITVHDGNILYADKDNSHDGWDQARNTIDYSIWGKTISEKYKGWDNNTSPNYIFGAGLFKVTGSDIKLNIGDTGTASAWFLYNTNVPQTSFDAEGPQKPSTTIHYHDNEIQIPALLTVKYIDQDTGKEIPNTQFNQKGDEGDAIAYSTKDTISKLQSQGYTLVSDGFTGKTGNKLSADNNGKTYVVTLRKLTKAKPSIPEKKAGKQTINIVDKKTGKVITTTVKDGKVGDNIAVSLQVPDGYHLVKGQSIPTSVNIKDKDDPINVYVEKDETKPVLVNSNDNNTKAKPAVATSVISDNKANKFAPVETKPVLVNNNDNSTKAKPAVATSVTSDSKTNKSAPTETKKSTANTVPVSTKVKPSTSNTPSAPQVASLPQTDNSSSMAGVLVGNALLATMATLGIAHKKRRD